MNDTNWRLLITPAQPGAVNMAIDHAIMEAVAESRTPPTLRFYAWEPPCLSLGYTQSAQDVDRARLQERGWQLVRRMTGGRAILHTDELTYSVAVKRDNPIVEGDVVASYRRLSAALLAGLELLGAAPQADRRDDGHATAKGPVCFEVPSHYEITVNEKKLVGSAQVRKFGAVLQHGSLPLLGDITRILDGLVFDSDVQRERVRVRVKGRAATLADVLARPVSWDYAVEAIARGFQSTFELDLVLADGLTPEEHARARELVTEQYATEEWLTRF